MVTSQAIKSGPETLPAGATLSEQVASGLEALSDFAAILTASMGSWWFVLGATGHDAAERYLFVSLIAAFVTVAVLGYLRMYDFYVMTEPSHHLRSLVGALLVTDLVLLFLAFSLGHADVALSRVWAYVFIASSVVTLLVSRGLFAGMLYRLATHGQIYRNVVIVGAGERSMMLLDSLARRRMPWLHIVGVFDDRATRLTGWTGDYPVHGTVKDLVNFSASERIDDVFVALPWTAEDRLHQIFDALQVIPANIHMSPTLLASRIERARFIPYFGITALRITKKPVEGWGYLVKWIEDKLIAFIAITLLSPVLLAIAAAIRLESRGPILFRQSRYGFNNQLFDVYKFRSMYHERRDDNAETLATHDDPRVTKVGHFLRHTSLDELPQILNVLKGDMSIVGPRPHAIRAKAGGRLYQDVVHEYAARHRIKPGITGWAQVNGWRGETDTEEKIQKRVAYDLYYIENWSIMMDIEIIFRTVFVVISGKAAY